MGYSQDKLSSTIARAPHEYTYRRLPPVYSRDFAYANSTTVVLRMARGNIGESTARSFAELLSGPTVNFYVGPDRRQWSVHRNLLCHHSTYFEAEFLNNELAKNNGELRLDLPEEDAAGFELLVKWLYQGRLDDMSDMTDEAKYEYSVACHKLYMLCDRFDLPLKNEAIDRYRQGLLEAQLVPDAEEINEIYSRSPLGSPFRKLMTQIAARQIMDPDSDKDAESYRRCFENNPDFAVDMVNAIKAGTGGLLFADPTDGNECDYHDHSDGQHCHVKGKDQLDPQAAAAATTNQCPHKKKDPNPLPRFLARRSKSTESAPAISYERKSTPAEEEALEEYLSPTRDNSQLRQMVRQSRSADRRPSTASSDSSAETDISGETLFSLPPRDADSNSSALLTAKLLPGILLLPTPPPEQGPAPPPESRAGEAEAVEAVEVEVEVGMEAEAEAEVEATEGTEAPHEFLVRKASLRRRGGNPPSYVAALRAKIPWDEKRGVAEGKSRGVWDYWRGLEGS